MKRLTKKKLGSSYPLKNDASAKIGLFTDYDGFFAFFEAVNRLGTIEDILGDDYDLSRLRKLVEADREGRRAALSYKKWVHLGGDEWCCSSCGNVIYTEGSWEKPGKKYCEECGAKMDVEQEE